MSNLETQFKEMQKQLDALSREVAALRETKSAAAFENLPSDAVVGKDYVAWKFGCSIRAILNGEAGTADIPRFSKCPLKFIKSKVDACFENRKKQPVAKRAKDAIKQAKPRRYSIVGKNKNSEQSI